MYCYGKTEVEHMKRLFSTLFMAAAMACLLTGCLFKSSDELYVLPKLSNDYKNLQDVLEQIVDSGLEYDAPKSGENTQAVQFLDLDGDGEEEVVAFFQEESGSKPLKIYLFQRTESDLYEVTNVIEGDGTAFHSIAYVDLNGTGTLELTVNYQISDLVYALSVYSIDGGTVSQLMQAGCTRYSIGDLDQDGVSELVLLQQDNSDEGGNRAEWYVCNGGTMELESTVPLSAGINGIKRVRSSKLAGEEPAIYVTGTYGESEDQLVTDILTVRDGEFVNLTMDEEAGISSTSLRRNTDDEIFATDLDGDGVYEIPFATELTDLGSSNVWSVDWIQYCLDGTQNTVCTTICSPKDGWYLTIPEELRGKIGATRSESSVGEEVSVTLYDITDMGADGEQPSAVMTVFVLTGANRVNRSKLSGRFVLSQGAEVIYAARVEENQWNVSQETVEEVFHFMPTNWSATD